IDAAVRGGAAATSLSGPRAVHCGVRVMVGSDVSFFKRNGLSLVLVSLFVAFLAAQVLSGHASHNEERQQSGFATLTLLAYLQSGHFVSVTFENWESEFLQMGMYVLLTVWLRRRGPAAWPACCTPTRWHWRSSPCSWRRSRCMRWAAGGTATRSG